MQVLTVFFLVFVLSVHVFSQTESFELQLRSTIPIGDQGRLYQPKKQQALIFNAEGTEVWNIETGELLRRLPSITTKFFLKDLSPDEEKFVAYDPFKKDAEIWDITNGKLIAAIPNQKNEIERVIWSPDSRFFLLSFSGNTNEVFVWNANTGRPQINIGSKFGVHAKFNPDGKRLLTAMDNVRFKQEYSVKLWETESGKLLKEFFPPVKNRYVSAQFTPDGKYILAKQDDTLFMWEIESGETRHVFKKGLPTSFSPDGKFLLVLKTKFRGLTKHDERWFEIYDIDTGEMKHELRTQKVEKHQVETHQVVWSPDGTLLCSAGEGYQKNYEAECWDILTGKQKIVLYPLVAKKERGLIPAPGYEDLDEISFTPDSGYLITRNSGYLRIWEADTGKLLKRFDASDGRFFFTYDGQYLGKMNEKEKTISFYKIINE